MKFLFLNLWVRSSFLNVILFCLGIFISGIAPVFADSNNEPRTGDELAASLRSLQPEKDSQMSGVLKIRRPGGKDEVPFTCKIETGEKGWRTIYETSPTSTRGAEKLSILRSPTGVNRYFYACAASPVESLPKLKEISADEAARPLAGSDFWLSELGFDFLDWPQQTKLKGEMRLGQPCYLLESSNPNAAKVVRVKSWIEKESAGPLIAEGYDANRKLVKEFSLSGSSIKKINGQWQVKKMTMRSPREKSETVLEFDLPD